MILASSSVRRDSAWVVLQMKARFPENLIIYIQITLLHIHQRLGQYCRVIIEVLRIRVKGRWSRLAMDERREHSIIARKHFRIDLKVLMQSSRVRAEPWGPAFQSRFSNILFVSKRGQRRAKGKQFKSYPKRLDPWNDKSGAERKYQMERSK